MEPKFSNLSEEEKSKLRKQRFQSNETNLTTANSLLVKFFFNFIYSY